MKRCFKVLATLLLICAILCVAVACGEIKGTQTNDNTNILTGDGSSADSEVNNPIDNSSDVNSDVNSEENSDVNSEESSDVNSEESSDVNSEESSDVDSDGVCLYALNKDGNGYAVRLTEDSDAVSVDIPAIYNDKPVTEIADSGFKCAYTLHSVTIPASVVGIGAHAFSQCRALSSVTFEPYSELKYIGEMAFYQCEYLDNVSLPTGLTEIGSRAFEGCLDLATLDVPDTLTVMGAKVFEETAFIDNITESGVYYFANVAYGYLTPDSNEGEGDKDIVLDIKEGTVSIAGEAFKGLCNVASVNIPSTVALIGKDAFTSADVGEFNVEHNAAYRVEGGALIENATDTLIKGTAKSTVTDNIKAIGDNAFRDVTGLTAITIPESVKSLGVSCFEGCTSLETVEMPESIYYIPKRAFRGCNSLNGFRVRRYVIEIQAAAFGDCTALRDIYIDSSPVILLSNGIYADGTGQIMEHAVNVYVSDTAFTLIRVKSPVTEELEWKDDPEQTTRQNSVYLAAFFTETESADGYTRWTINS